MTSTESRPLLSIKDFNFTAADFIKAVVIIVAAAMAWAGTQSKLESINGRLERLENSTTFYVRSDVQSLQNQRIDDRLKVIMDQMDRMDKKLDFVK